MKRELLGLYSKIKENRVLITGSPQFDFHFKKGYYLSREELCGKIGIDPSRPYILYTAGMDRDFPEEYRHVQAIIKIIDSMEKQIKPQLVVRLYIKGISKEMKTLYDRKSDNVVFPPILWDEKWFTPKYEDLAIYTS